MIGVIRTDKGDFFLEASFEEMPKIVPCVRIERYEANYYRASIGSIDLSNCKTGFVPEGENKSYILENCVPLPAAHWSFTAMVKLAQDKYKKVIKSSAPVALAKLASESVDGFLEFDGRNANWNSDLKILSQVIYWEHYSAGQNEMLEWADRQGILPTLSSQNSEKWLATRIARLKKKYT